MYIIFFLSTILLGSYLLSFFPKSLPFLVKLCLIYLLGTLFLTGLFLIIYPLLSISPLFLYLPFILLSPLILRLKKSFVSLVTDVGELLLLVLLLFFSAFLFFKTVWMDFETSQTLIAGKLWSDFGAHIPLIRSFFSGFNFPPQYPLFPGEPIRYHFLFDFQIALLEKLGLPLGFAINLPSIFSFTGLLLLIYSLSFLCFKKKSVGILAVVLTLFNSSLAFLNLFKKTPFPNSSFPDNIFTFINNLITKRELLAFGPYDGGVITAFWNLNVYTNQRHFAFALALILLVSYLLLERHFSKETTNTGNISYVVIGLVIGLLPLVHSGVFIIAVLSLPLFFFLIFNTKYLILLLLPVIIALPQLLYFKSGGSFVPEANIRVLPFFNFFSGKSIADFFNFWWLNLGLTPFIAFFGFLLAPKRARFLFLFGLLPFFIGNFISFSPDINTNHKFFNFVVIILNVYAAYFLVLLAQTQGRRAGTRFILVIILFFFLTLSGLLDFFSAVNDNYFGLPDPKQKDDIVWIEKNTPKNAVFSNSFWLYHPASLAGRRIVLGWPYFSWSAGYDTTARDKKQRFLYSINDKAKTCEVIKDLKTGYVTISTQIKDEATSFNLEFWQKNFPLLYQNQKSGFFVFDARGGCLL